MPRTKQTQPRPSLHGALAGKLLLCLMATLCLTTSTGCIARMLDFGVYVFKGRPLLPAEYEGLKGKRVAVVCVSVANSFGPDSTTSRISRGVRSLLAANISDIDVVRDSEVADWLDHHDWSNVDYTEVGRGVKADQVVVIELNEPIQLREGPTLMRGLADFTVTVVDVASDGEKVFRRRQGEFRWPSEARYGISEAKFEQAFVRRLCGRVGQYFYGVEANADIAENTSDINGL